MRHLPLPFLALKQVPGLKEEQTHRSVDSLLFLLIFRIAESFLKVGTFFSLLYLFNLVDVIQGKQSCLLVSQPSDVKGIWSRRVGFKSWLCYL